MVDETRQDEAASQGLLNAYLREYHTLLERNRRQELLSGRSAAHQAKAIENQADAQKKLNDAIVDAGNFLKKYTAIISAGALAVRTWKVDTDSARRSAELFFKTAIPSNVQKGGGFRQYSLMGDQAKRYQRIMQEDIKLSWEFGETIERVSAISDKWNQVLRHGTAEGANHHLVIRQLTEDTIKLSKALGISEDEILKYTSKRMFSGRRTYGEAMDELKLFRVQAVQANEELTKHYDALNDVQRSALQYRDVAVWVEDYTSAVMQAAEGTQGYAVDVDNMAAAMRVASVEAFKMNRTFDQAGEAMRGMGQLLGGGGSAGLKTILGIDLLQEYASMSQGALDTALSKMEEGQADAVRRTLARHKRGEPIHLLAPRLYEELSGSETLIRKQVEFISRFKSGESSQLMVALQQFAPGLTAKQVEELADIFYTKGGDAFSDEVVSAIKQGSDGIESWGDGLREAVRASNGLGSSLAVVGYVVDRLGTGMGKVVGYFTDTKRLMAATAIAGGVSAAVMARGMGLSPMQLPGLAIRGAAGYAHTKLTSMREGLLSAAANAPAGIGGIGKESAEQAKEALSETTKAALEGVAEKVSDTGEASNSTFFGMQKALLPYSAGGALRVFMVNPGGGYGPGTRVGGGVAPLAGTAAATAAGTARAASILPAGARLTRVAATPIPFMVGMGGRAASAAPGLASAEAAALGVGAAGAAGAGAKGLGRLKGLRPSGGGLMTAGILASMLLPMLMGNGDGNRPEGPWTTEAEKKSRSRSSATKKGLGGLFEAAIWGPLLWGGMKKFAPGTAGKIGGGLGRGWGALRGIGGRAGNVLSPLGNIARGAGSVASGLASTGTGVGTLGGGTASLGALLGGAGFAGLAGAGGGLGASAWAGKIASEEAAKRGMNDVRGGVGGLGDVLGKFGTGSKNQSRWAALNPMNLLYAAIARGGGKDFAAGGGEQGARKSATTVGMGEYYEGKGRRKEAERAAIAAEEMLQNQPVTDAGKEYVAQDPENHATTRALSRWRASNPAEFDRYMRAAHKPVADLSAEYSSGMQQQRAPGGGTPSWMNAPVTGSGRWTSVSPNMAKIEVSLSNPNQMLASGLADAKRYGGL